MRALTLRTYERALWQVARPIHAVSIAVWRVSPRAIRFDLSSAVWRVGNRIERHAERVFLARMTAYRNGI